ncbi:MAG: hypothetical protein ACR2IK_16385 [Chloroflexota bacterium]
MPAYMLRINDSALGLVHIAARWLDEADMRQPTDLVARLVNESVASGPESGCTNVVTQLHHFLLSKGDDQKLREEFRAEQYQWYLAQSELLVTSLEQTVISACNVGTMKAFLFRRRAMAMLPLNASHTLASEVSAGTIEESCIAPFATRTNGEIATQLLAASPEMIARLIPMDRGEFVATLGTAATRLIGYFPDARRAGFYRRQPPNPQFAQLPTEIGDAVLFYRPTRKYLKLEHEPDLLSQLKHLLIGNPSTPASSSVPINRGWVVGAEITQKNQFGELRTYGELA